MLAHRREPWEGVVPKFVGAPAGRYIMIDQREPRHANMFRSYGALAHRPTALPRLAPWASMLRPDGAGQFGALLVNGFIT